MSTGQSAPNTLDSEQRLSDLKPGETAIVERLALEGEERWRLMDLGLLPGTRVVTEMEGPLGFTTAYRIRGSLIALRADQARLIYVKRQ